MAATGQADPLPVGDAGGDVDLERTASDLAATAVAVLARCLGDLAVACTDVTGDSPHDLAERGPADGLQAPGAAAAVAGLDRRAGLGAVAVADLTDIDAFEAQRNLAAGR